MFACASLPTKGMGWWLLRQVSLEVVATNCKSNVGCWSVQSKAMRMSISLAPLLGRKEPLSFCDSDETFAFDLA